MAALSDLDYFTHSLMVYDVAGEHGWKQVVKQV
ncbi:hypothetical protein FHS85_005021 [Rhodoligotrophos appendicifer]